VGVARSVGEATCAESVAKIKAAGHAQSGKNVPEGVSFCHLKTSPSGRASSFRCVGVYIG